MSYSLVFIERLDEIDLLESFVNADAIIISMLPSVSSELKRRGISFETTLSFFGVEDHLLASDLLLSYCSTTIEEALQNHVPVLQYDHDGKYEHIPGEVLSTSSENKVSAIYSVMSESNLIPALQWWSKNHSESKNKMISWSDHIFDFDDKMEWLSHMESKKC